MTSMSGTNVSIETGFSGEFRLALIAFESLFGTVGLDVSRQCLLIFEGGTYKSK